MVGRGGAARRGTTLRRRAKVGEPRAGGTRSYRYPTGTALPRVQQVTEGLMLLPVTRRAEGTALPLVPEGSARTQGTQLPPVT